MGQFKFFGAVAKVPPANVRLQIDIPTQCQSDRAQVSSLDDLHEILKLDVFWVNFELSGVEKNPFCLLLSNLN